MKVKLTIIMITCILGLGILLVACNKQNSNTNAENLLLLKSSSAYFPEIPKGVAQ